MEEKVLYVRFLYCDDNETTISDFEDCLDRIVDFRTTPLHSTAKYDHLGFVKYLVNQKFDISVINNGDENF